MDTENTETNENSGAAFPEAIQDETIETNDVDLRGTPYKRKVEVQVSDAEILERHDQHLKIELEIDNVKADRAAEMADYNARLKELRQRRQELINAIHTKKELRELDVYDAEVTDQAGNIVRFEIRDWHTNEIVDERAATPQEEEARRQPDLFADAEPPAADDPTPEEAAVKAEEEGRVVRTNSAEVKRKSRSRKLKAVESNGEGATDAATSEEGAAE